MITNGTTPTSQGAIYTVPGPSPGAPNSGNAQEFDLFRFVNSTSASITLSIWLKVNGTPRLLTPKDLILPAGAAWDDVPVFQLPVAGVIMAEASDAGVDWTLNRYYVNV